QADRALMARDFRRRAGSTGARAVTVQNGGTLAPGDGVGQLTTGAQDWNAGGTFAWELGNATGSNPGADWDHIQMTSLNLSALGTSAGQQFTIKLVGIPPAPVDKAYQWTIATASSGITNPTGGFDQVLFYLDRSNDSNNG